MSNRPDPKIVGGLRSIAETRQLEPDRPTSGATPLRDPFANTPPRPRSPARRVGEVTFGSRYHAHRIQVTAPADITDPFTGQKKVGRPVSIQFRQGVHTTSDPFVIHFLLGCPPSCAGHGEREIKVRYETHVAVLRGEIWDVSVRAKRDQENTAKELAGLVKAHPELVDQILNELASSTAPSPSNPSAPSGSSAGTSPEPSSSARP